MVTIVLKKIIWNLTLKLALKLNLKGAFPVGKCD